MKLRWIDPVELVEYELTQQEEEGRDVSDFRKRWKDFRSSDHAPGQIRLLAESLLNELNPPGSPRGEAESHETLSTASRNPPVGDPNGARPPEFPIPSPTVLSDRIAGGWFGRAAGCLLGKPVEGMSRGVIREMLSSNGSWPLSDYVTQKGIPENLLLKHPWNRHEGKASLRENIVCMTEDDDMNYPMVNLSLLESAGREFSTEQVAEAWLGMIPVLSTFTAERVAYVNCLEGLVPPLTATHRNPYREWIGAQIRGDVFGWVSPGDPRAAAGLASKDARLSHVRNGMYGEMFVAATVAAACVVGEPREAIDAGLRCIPSDSLLAEAVRFALSVSDAEPAFEKAVDRLYERFGKYHWVHTINNASLVVTALMYGKGEFGRTICNVVMGGWDTDSNGATAGSIVGTILGAKRLPQRWIGPLHDRIRSSVKGFDNSAISSLAERTCAIASTSRQGNNALKS